ncbi:MAG: MMPL family transporter, partial [Micrococcaceae bacterium]|nr:MMPL family transporter [Micrococcaceae bacterium]
MPTFLHRLGSLAYRRPWAFITVWLLILGSILAVAATTDAHITSSMTIDGTPSEQVQEKLQSTLPAATGGQGTLVFAVPAQEQLNAGQRAGAIAEAAEQISVLPLVTDRSSASGPSGPAKPPVDSTQPYQTLVIDGSPVPGIMVSMDGSVAMLKLQFTTPIDELPDGTLDEVVTTAQGAVAGTDVTVLPSDSLDTMHPPIGGHEAIGLGIALIVLLLTLGSLWAAGLPLLTALIGVAIGIGGAFALSTSITLTTATPALALMVGLAVGIDYALFIVNRQRQLIINDQLSAPEATARSMATAGSAVVFAGSTVVIALAGLTVIGVGFLTTMALVAAATVTLAVLIALTLLPALLGLLGERICSDAARQRGRAAHRAPKQPIANRWVTNITARPWVAVTTVVLLLGLAAIPALSMDLGMPTGANDSRENTSRQGYDAITRGFGEGFNAPLLVVAQPVNGSSLDQAALGALTAGLRTTKNVATASLTGVDPGHTLAVFTVIPEQGPTDEQTSQLVTDLRNPNAGLASQTGVSLGVTGLTAINLDITTRLGEALPRYLLIITGLSLLLLLLVFRSVVIPLKATAGFLLSIAATFGISTAVFQWGWLIKLVGLDTGGPLLSFLPIMVTGILYGLAMDYQVFLVSSMREAHILGMTSQRAIIHGFTHASRVVLAAAV